MAVRVLLFPACAAPAGVAADAGYAPSVQHDTSTQKYRRWSGFYRPRGACLAAGGNWWLPLSHRVVGAPEPPSVTSVSDQETTSSICVHGGEAPRRVRGAVQKSSPPPLRPRAPFNNPPGPPCAAGVAPGGPTHPWPCPPQVQLLRSKPGASARSAMGERAVQTILRKKEPSK